LKRSFTILAVLAVIIFLFSGCSKTVARADGIEVKQKEVDVYIDFIMGQSSTEETALDEEQLSEMQASIIDSLIVIKLLEKYAEENGIAVTGDEVEEQIKSIIDSYPSEEDFKKELEENGIDRQFLEGELRNQLIRTKIFEGVTKDVIVTDKEIEQYYEDNKETFFLVPASVKAGHILAMFPWKKDNSAESEEGRIEAMEKIEMIEEKLKSGGDFEELAQRYSDDEATSENGGNLDYISEGQMVEEFDRVLFSLGEGEISEIIETEFGFHIIKVYDCREEYIQDFDEVRESISTYLLSLYKNSKWEDFIFSLIDEADIEYLTDVEGTLSSINPEDVDSEIPVETESE
jgi:parvulin-like peptidyl-prolyl isomerase